MYSILPPIPPKSISTSLPPPTLCYYLKLEKKNTIYGIHVLLPIYFWVWRIVDLPGAIPLKEINFPSLEGIKWLFSEKWRACGSILTGWFLKDVWPGVPGPLRDETVQNHSNLLLNTRRSRIISECGWACFWTPRRRCKDSLRTHKSKARQASITQPHLWSELH